MGMPDHILATQLHIAKGYYAMGVIEEPVGSNRGFWVEEFIEDGGGNPGDAWCMHGVYACHVEACRIQRLKYPLLKRTGRCKTQWLYAVDNPKLTIIQAPDILRGHLIPDGAIWVKVRADGTGHTGFVIDHDPDTNTMKSLECNCGNKVDIKEYIISNIADFKGVIL